MRGEVLLALAWHSDPAGDAGPPALLSVRAAAALLPDLEDAPIPDEAENFEEEPELEEVEG